jgi:NADPH:quinone reductase-like Zn-dependent oxidoreductase
LNFRDLVVIAGGYGAQMPPPLVPCSDGSGTVLAVGDGVRRFAPGDRVMTNFFQRWPAGAPTQAALSSSLGGPLDGALRERACFAQEGLCPVPKHMSTRAAATLPCAAVTAWNALAVLDHVGPAHTVLVQGTGGVSLFALQLAKLRGARVIATSSSASKLERLRALGADEVIDYVQEPEWGKAAKALTSGRGVDHVIEVGGAGTLAQSLRAAAPGACISLIGVLSGAKQTLHLPHVFLTQVRLQGVVVGSRQCAEELVRALENHAGDKTAPVIDPARFALSDARAAFEHMQARGHIGKIVIDIQERA